jgi:hypothetical protein
MDPTARPCFCSLSVLARRDEVAETAYYRQDADDCMVAAWSVSISFLRIAYASIQLHPASFAFCFDLLFLAEFDVQVANAERTTVTSMQICTSHPRYALLTT